MTSYFAAGLLFLAAIASAQTVCIGTTEECRQSQTEFCAHEPAPPNLTVPRAAKVVGIVRDQSGAPFADGMAIQLRTSSTGRVIRSTVPRANGSFALGSVPAGTYRLIIVSLRKGRVERLAGFDQPSTLQCMGNNSCEITVVPRGHATDNPIDLCGPK
jgi:hypothetical protein